MSERVAPRTRHVPGTQRPLRNVVVGAAIALAVPVLVAAVVAHDVDRVLLPAGFMLIGVAIGTILGGWPAGLVGVVASTLLLDYYFLAPRNQFVGKNGEELGALLMFSTIVIGFSVALEVLRGRAVRAAEARVRAEAEVSSTRRTVVTLQQTLLPHHPPDFPGVDIECRYVSAGGDGVVGGDWYAVVPITANRLGVAIGDVAGHGLLASQVMAETRFALRGLAISDVDPGVCLDVLNQVLFRFGERPHVTATYGVLDLERGEWTQAVAGHPPALCRERGGAVHTLDQPPGLPLGVDATTSYTTRTFALGRDATLLLYTDGLCERRGETIDAGIARLGDAFRAVTGDDTSLADGTDSLLARMCTALPDDDVALVAVRRHATTASVSAPIARHGRIVPLAPGRARRPRDPDHQLRSA